MLKETKDIMTKAIIEEVRKVKGDLDVIQFEAPPYFYTPKAAEYFTRRILEKEQVMQELIEIGNQVFAASTERE